MVAAWDSLAFAASTRGGIPSVLTGSIKVRPRSVTLPRIGCVRTKEPTAKFRGRILSATVSREADRWVVP
jgi:hypothetical protein